MKPDAPVIEIKELVTRHEELLSRLLAGQEVILSDHGTKIGTVNPENTVARVPQLGPLKGQIWIADDFNDPLPPDVVAEFYK